MRMFFPKFVVIGVIFGISTLQAIASETKPKTKTPVTKAEFMKKAYDRFSKLDTNHDGFITAKERTAKRDKKRRASKLKRFKKMDTDNDGYLSEEELLQAEKIRTEKAAETSEKKADDWFEMADVDNNGYLSKEEYRTKRLSARSAYYTYNPDKQMRYYKHLDIDEDGIVSQSEYVDKIGRYGKSDKNNQNPYAIYLSTVEGSATPLTAQDANKDKKISRSENEKFQAALFERCDKDKNGELSGKELKHYNRYKRLDRTR